MMMSYTKFELQAKVAFQKLTKIVEFILNNKALSQKNLISYRKERKYWEKRYLEGKLLSKILIWLHLD